MGDIHAVTCSSQTTLAASLDCVISLSKSINGEHQPWQFKVFMYTRWYDCVSGGGKFKPIIDISFILLKNIRNICA